MNILEEKYQQACDDLQNVMNEAQNSFDSYRKTFPDDFNFDRFLMSECPKYHEVILKRDKALRELQRWS